MVGQRIFVERVPFVIVGVTAADFVSPSMGIVPDLMLPIGTRPLFPVDDAHLDTPDGLKPLLKRIRSSGPREKLRDAIAEVECPQNAKTAISRAGLPQSKSDQTERDCASPLYEAFRLV